jgi:hypothetical protein
VHDQAESTRLLIEGLIWCTADTNWRVLQPHFPRYESLAGIARPDRRFRWGIAVALAKYMIHAADTAGAPERRHQHSTRLRALAKQRNQAWRIWEMTRRLGQSSGFDPALLAAPRTAAFQMWAAARLIYDDARQQGARRGRPRKVGDELFARELAALYQRATRNQPTIVENQARAYNENVSQYTGPFAALLQAVQTDARDIFRQIDPDLAHSLSTNIARKAKGLRLTRTSMV